MNQKIIIAYIYDFLSHIFENKIPVNKIILFGSIARNEFDKQSDIDLFIEPKQKSKIKEIETKIKEIKQEFESEKEHTWTLKNINYPIRELIGDLEDPTWKTLKEDIISNGIMLYGKYEELPKEIKHYALINYSLKNLKQKEKMKFLRTLFGYSIKKAKKIYKQEGFIQQINGKKLTKNIILIPLDESARIKDLFEKFKIKIEMREIWQKKFES